jgi:diguanylate cyclase (GGDEF)-like protein
MTTQPKKMGISRLFRMLNIVVLLAGVIILTLTGYGVHEIFTRNVIGMAKSESVLISDLIADQQHHLLFSKDHTDEHLISIPSTFKSTVDQNMRTFLPHFDIVKIKIFNLDTEIIYSTDSQIIGKTDLKNDRLHRALKGDVDSHLEHKESLRDLSQEEQFKVDVVETYVPVIIDGDIVAVFELYRNVTEYSQEITTRTLQTVFLLAAIMLITYFFAFAIARLGMKRAEEAEEKLHTLATTDALTGIYNRGELMTRGEEELARVVRHGAVGGRGELSVIMLDIDHFKLVNDTHGHQAGDAVLEQLAGRIKKGLRLYDVLGRYGGEEFMLLLPTADLTVSERIAERIRLSIETQSFSYNDIDIPITISLGVATFSPDFNLENAIGRADSALYRAKEKGRNRVEATA